VKFGRVGFLDTRPYRQTVKQTYTDTLIAILRTPILEAKYYSLQYATELVNNCAQPQHT